MRSALSKAFSYIKKRKILFSLVALVAVVGTVVASTGGNGKVETVSPQMADLVRSVKISGKIVPEERVDLGFEISGTVISADKPVGSTVVRGDTLARLDSGGLSAELLRAEAELSSTQAELGKLEGTEAFENSVTNAKRSVTQSILKAYSAASDAVLNKSDQLFTNPRSKTTTPVLTGNLNSYIDLRDSIESGRIRIGTTLEKWQELIANLNSSSASYSAAQLDLSKQYLDEVTSFIADVSRAVNLFEPSTLLSQTTIDGYKDLLLSARDGLSTAAKSFIDTESALSKLLGDVPVQVARVEAAKASVLNLRYQLGKTRLVSPISGIVARQDAKPGQAALSGTNVVSVISKEYVIETYVPEVSIVGVKPGDAARVTLDAYGSQAVFEARVASIEPAETIRDGVSTYKTELAFVLPDERIRSGMTANVEIETFRKPSVMLVPDRTVVRENSGAYVYVLVESRREKRDVVLGERDTKGNVEILSGLALDDKVLVNPVDK